MQAVAKKKSIHACIWAVGDSLAKENVDKADVILLGPQIRYALTKIKNLVNDEKPVSCIDMKDYGKMDGEKILDFALNLIEKKEK